MSEEWIRKAVDQFILNEIESVPHLEALLLLWNTRPKQWPVDEMAKALYVSPETAQRIMQELARRGLVATQTEPERYSYVPQSDDKDTLMSAVDEIYRRELVRISRMIHGKAPSAVREFARAFRFTKEKEPEKE
jgi:predicted ArsR family transcriptional regulator